MHSSVGCFCNPFTSISVEEVVLSCLASFPAHSCPPVGKFVLKFGTFFSHHTSFPASPALRREVNWSGYKCLKRCSAHHLSRMVQNKNGNGFGKRGQEEMARLAQAARTRCTRTVTCVNTYRVTSTVSRKASQGAQNFDP